MASRGGNVGKVVALRGARRRGVRDPLSGSLFDTEERSGLDESAARRKGAQAGGARVQERSPARRPTPPRSATIEREPFSAAAGEARELWIAAHLPGLAMSGPATQRAPDRLEPRAGAGALERLAMRAQRFTPRVSVVPPDGLLLEVKGSLHLFGGVEALLRAVESECVAQGVQPVLSLAPVPLAALASARAGQSLRLTESSRLIGALSALPLTALRWPPDVIDRLGQMGVRTIGPALRLPRAGFARRFGAAQLASLDRLIGRAADPQEPFRARERFRGRRALTYELEHQGAILEALRPLLEDLDVFLRTRQCGITALECRLTHRHAPPTRCVLRLARPEADVKLITALLGERLSMISLPEPVRDCELRSGPLLRRVLASDSLWRGGEHGGEVGAESPALLERLRARLGEEAVYGLQMLAGHRPEMAWRAREPRVERQRAARSPDAPSSASERNSGAPGAMPWEAFRHPLWLLPAPRLLREREGLPQLRGPLRLLGNPERIETGWWDGGEIARDYYVAADGRGVRLWVYRERAEPHRWFLHGVFG